MLLPQLVLCGLLGGPSLRAVPDISAVLEGQHWLVSRPGLATRLAWEFFILNTCDDPTLISAIKNYLRSSRASGEADVGGLYFRELDVGILIALRFGDPPARRRTYGGGASLLIGAWAQTGPYRVLRPERRGGFATDHYYGLEDYTSRVRAQIPEFRTRLRLWW